MLPAATRRGIAGAVIALSVVGGALVTTACGTEPTAEEERRRLAEDLVTEVGPRLGREEADCLAERLHEEYGEDAFVDVLDAAEDRSGDHADAVRAAVIDIFASCGALEAVASTDG